MNKRQSKQNTKSLESKTVEDILTVLMSKRAKILKETKDKCPEVHDDLKHEMTVPIPSSRNSRVGKLKGLSTCRLHRGLMRY